MISSAVSFSVANPLITVVASVLIPEMGCLPEGLTLEAPGAGTMFSGALHVPHQQVHQEVGVAVAGLLLLGSWSTHGEQKLCHGGREQGE